jgi:hypothetical protein
MVKRVDHEISFQARDREGNTYVLDVFVDVMDIASRDNPQAEAKGVAKLRREAASL